MDGVPYGEYCTLIDLTCARWSPRSQNVTAWSQIVKSDSDHIEILFLGSGECWDIGKEKEWYGVLRMHVI